LDLSICCTNRPQQTFLWEGFYEEGFESGLPAGFGAGLFGVGRDTPMLIST
jgi:hypothetical protein